MSDPTSEAAIPKKTLKRIRAEIERQVSPHRRWRLKNDEKWARDNAWDYTQTNDRQFWETPEIERVEQAVRALKTHPEGGFQTLLELAEQGSVWSMIRLANCYRKGNGVEASLAKSNQWLRRAAKAGSQYAQLIYGRRCFNQAEWDECERVFGLGVAENWAPALYWLARSRIKRSPTRQSFREARGLLERAMELGSPAALHALGLWMSRGRFGFKAIPHGIALLWRYVTDEGRYLEAQAFSTAARATDSVD